MEFEMVYILTKEKSILKIKLACIRTNEALIWVKDIKKKKKVASFMEHSPKIGKFSIPWMAFIEW